MSWCKALAALHNATPPLVHRDLRIENAVGGYITIHQPFCLRHCGEQAMSVLMCAMALGSGVETRLHGFS